MGDQYDALADKLGIPATLRAAWRASAGAPAPAQLDIVSVPRVNVPMGPRPGDPGWNITGSAPPPAPLPAPPSGPRPGDPGFSIVQPQPPAPSPPPKTSPSAPQRPMTAEERARAMVASSASAEAVGANAAEQERLKKQGIPMATSLPPAMASRIAAASNVSDANARAANETAQQKKNIEGATFAESSGAGAGASPLTMVSPGGRQPHSWAVQEGTPQPLEATQAATASDEHARTAAALDYQSGTKAAEFEAGYLDRLEQAQRSHAVEEKSRGDRYMKAYDESLGRLNDLRAQVRSAQVDPYEGQPGAAQLMGALAIGVGAAGSALSGGPNAGLEAVKQRISTTIRRQEGVIDRIGNGIKGEQTFLGTLRQKFGDEKEANNAAWIAYLEATKAELAKMMGSPDVSNPKLLAQYERVKKGIDDELAMRLKSWNEAASDKVVRHDVNAPPTYAGGTAMSATDEKSNQELTDRLVKTQVPGMRNDADRLLAVIPKSGDVPGVTSLGAGTANTLGGTAEKVYGAGYNILGSTQGQEIRQAAAVLFNRQLKDESGAAVSDQELERQKAAFYGARNARSARAAITNYVNRLNALESTIRSGFKGNVNETQRQRRAGEEKRLAPQKKFSGPEEPK